MVRWTNVFADSLPPDLHKAWPEAEFHLVADAGHSAKETETRHWLVTYMDNLAQNQDLMQSLSA